jgi:crotonobetaine/carnitine-CoA ligase
MADTPAALRPPFAGTAGGLLLDTARNAPAQVLLVHEGREITVGALAAAACAAARALRGRGVGPGEPVLTMLSPGPDHIATALGIALADALWVPLAPDARGPSLAHALRVARPALAIVGPEAEAALREAGWRGPLERRDGWRWIPAEWQRAEWQRAEGPAMEPPRDADTHRAILFTSGTTGPPKGVIVTERMLLASAAGCALASDCTPGDAYLMWEPMHHIGGPQLLLMALAGQARLVTTRRFSASRFWGEIRHHEVTKLHYLGGILEILLKAEPRPDDRDHPVALAFGGGCRPEVRRAFEKRFGIPIREVYGMTEASSFTTVDLRGVPGAVGTPVPWLDVELVGPDGAALAGAAEGEIVVRPRQDGLLTPGYRGNPEATARLLRDGRLFTGDLGARDPEGNLRFLGRMSDSLRRRGENVSAWEVETALVAHPDIAEAAVVGVPSEIGEHDILCFVAMSHGTAFRPALLADWAGAHMPHRHVPRYWKQVESFERTPSQRIRKDRLDRSLSDAFDRGDR